MECRTKVGTVFSKHFSMVRRPNLVLTSLKSASKMRIYLLFCLPKSSFGRHKVVTKIVASQKTNTSPRMLLSFVIILQSCYKDSSIAENQHIASNATIFCNHLAKLLQKIVASQKPTHRMRLSFVTILQSYAPQTKIFKNRKTFPTVVLSTFQGCEY